MSPYTTPSAAREIARRPLLRGCAAAWSVECASVVLTSPVDSVVRPAPQPEGSFRATVQRGGGIRGAAKRPRKAEALRVRLTPRTASPADHRFSQYDILMRKVFAGCRLKRSCTSPLNEFVPSAES